MRSILCVLPALAALLTACGSQVSTGGGLVDLSGSGGSGAGESSGGSASDGAAGGCQTGGDATPPPPSAGAPTTKVKDLSDAEAQAWCGWYVAAYPNADVNPSPESAATTEIDGYVLDYAAAYCHAPLLPGVYCLTWPKIDDCVRNLRHAPCEATMAELDDCVLSFLDSHRNVCPACVAVGVGCGPLLQATGCAGTVIGPPSGEGCPLAVE